jgi:hypothetical protein
MIQQYHSWGYTQKTVTQVTPETRAHPCLLQHSFTFKVCFLVFFLLIVLNTFCTDNVCIKILLQGREEREKGMHVRICWDKFVLKWVSCIQWESEVKWFHITKHVLILYWISLTSSIFHYASFGRENQWYSWCFMKLHVLDIWILWVIVFSSLMENILKTAQRKEKSQWK